MGIFKFDDKTQAGFTTRTKNLPAICGLFFQHSRRRSVKFQQQQDILERGVQELLHDAVIDTVRPAERTVTIYFARSFGIHDRAGHFWWDFTLFR